MARDPESLQIGIKEFQRRDTYAMLVEAMTPPDVRFALRMVHAYIKDALEDGFNIPGVATVAQVEDWYRHPSSGKVAEDLDAYVSSITGVSVYKMRLWRDRQVSAFFESEEE